jgi:hypothetical protein
MRVPVMVAGLLHFGFDAVGEVDVEPRVATI